MKGQAKPLRLKKGDLVMVVGNHQLQGDTGLVEEIKDGDFVVNIADLGIRTFTREQLAKCYIKLVAVPYPGEPR